MARVHKDVFFVVDSLALGFDALLISAKSITAK